MSVEASPSTGPLSVLVGDLTGLQPTSSTPAPSGPTVNAADRRGPSPPHIDIDSSSCQPAGVGDALVAARRLNVSGLVRPRAPAGDVSTNVAVAGLPPER